MSSEGGGLPLDNAAFFACSPDMFTSQSHYSTIIVISARYDYVGIRQPGRLLLIRRLLIKFARDTTDG